MKQNERLGRVQGRVSEIRIWGESWEASAGEVAPYRQLVCVKPNEKWLVVCMEVIS